LLLGTYSSLFSFYDKVGMGSCFMICCLLSGCKFETPN
jgi:hypothetical protein